MPSGRLDGHLGTRFRGAVLRLASIGFAALSCATRPAPSTAAPEARAVDDVVYRLDLSAPDMVAVELRATARAAAAGLRVPLEWEGRSGFDRNIRIVDVRDGTGRALSHSVERWTLRAPGATGPLVVRYQVTTRGGLDAQSEGYPIRAVEYFVSTGHPLFLVPEGWVESGEGRYRVEVTAPSGWPIFTSAGGATAERQGQRALLDLVIAAGDFTNVGEAAGGGAALIARGSWPWAPGDLARPAQAVLAEARALFGAAPDRESVFLLPWPPAAQRVGHRLHQATLLAAGAAFDPAEPEVVSFLASLLVRRWVGEGGLLHHRGDSLYDTLWFREGIPRYYGVVLPVRAGQLPRERALERLQEAIVNAYRRDAIRDLRPYDLKRWVHWDERVARSNAQKGALVALLLDMRLRARGKSLDGWLQHMATRMAGRRYTAADLSSEASTYAGEDLSAFFADHVVGIKPLPIESWLREAGLGVASVREPFTDFGMAMRVEDGVLRLCDVRQAGAAHRAGLRESEVVQDYYIQEGRFDLPAWVRVDRGGQSTTIRFQPDRSERDVSRLTTPTQAAESLVAGMWAGRK